MKAHRGGDRVSIGWTPLIAGAALVLAAHGAAGQSPPLDLSSFYHALNTGAGARAWGMGGTAIALADVPEDATWNPAAAGALQRPAAVAAFSGDRLAGDFDRIRYVLSSGPSGTISPGRTTATAARFQAVQFSYPVTVVGRRFVTTVAYRRRLSLPDQADSAYVFHNQSLYRFDYDYQFHALGNGGFDTLDVSLASNLHPAVRAGVTIHRWFGRASSSYRESYLYSVSNYYGWDGAWNERLGDDVRLEMSGFSVDLGAQAAIRGKYFAGVVFRSGVEADLRYSNTATYENALSTRSATASHSGRGSLSLPASVGAGLGFRPVARLTLAVDQAWAFWSTAILEGYGRTTALGGVPQPAILSYPTGASADLRAQSSTSRTSIGLEYFLAAGRLRIPLRAGLSYQQAYDDTGRGGTATSTGTGVRWRAMSVDAAWVREAASGRYARQSVTLAVGWTF